jgi:protein-S-isoprenylcysteine O-methyltransferase Ste14
MWLSLRSLFAAVLLPGTATIFVPWILYLGDEARRDLGPLRYAALLSLAAGAAGLGWCIIDFARTGRGTLAPFDPPRFVVRGGLYRWVRNPMYVNVVLILASEALLLGSPAIARWALVVAISFHLFVVLYEEPTLKRKFGPDYEKYLQDVPRWIPRRPTE